MRVIVNPKNLVPNESWQRFRKVRAIIENDLGCIAISIEGGKCIFPGGKCEMHEEELVAIQREVKEETGIDFNLTDFQKVLELETIYDDFFDYRSGSIKPRHTITTYYYIRTKENINFENMSLTEDEIARNFDVFFVEMDALLKLLHEDHSQLENGKFFDEENKIVVERILKK